MYETSSGEVLKSDGERNRSLSIDENLIVYKHPVSVSYDYMKMNRG